MSVEYYLQVDGSTSIFSLDIIADLQTGLPESNYKLENSLTEGGFVTGIGSRTGREISCSYQFKGNEDYERELFLDQFTRPVDADLYLYKDIKRRSKTTINSGSTIVYLTGSTADIAALSTSKAVAGIGIPSTAYIDTIGTTYSYISDAATMSLTNHDLQFDTFLGRMRVYGFPKGGEGWDNVHISNNVEFSLLSPSPYFESTTLTIAGITSTGYNEFSTFVNIKGRRVTALYELTLSTSSSSITFFQVKTAEDYGFRVDRQGVAGDVFLVDTSNSNLTFTYNGNEELGRFDPVSSPFTLERGINNLNIVASETTSAGLKIKYYERRL